MNMNKTLYAVRNIPALVRSGVAVAGVCVAGRMGVASAIGKLYAQIRRADGTLEDLGFVSARVVTDAGVSALCTDWPDGSADITNFNFHDCGTGTTAEATGDTALVTPYGGSRGTGTKTKPLANKLQSVATINFTSTLAITEHGLFSATSAGTLWDRSVFSAINVNNGDSIQFIYICTINSGG